MVKLIGLLLIIWLVIGAVAAVRRHYYSGSTTDCAKDSATAVMIVAGPLNYVGCESQRPLQVAAAQQLMSSPTMSEEIASDVCVLREAARRV